MVPGRPHPDMDSLAEKYAMPVDISNIEPFQRLRDLMGFYATEASRALVEVAKARSHVRYLQRRLSGRRSTILAQGASITKWRAEAAVDADPSIRELTDSIGRHEGLIDILRSLQETYAKNYEVLSRELTARTNDRDRWYGRGGDGR